MFQIILLGIYFIIIGYLFYLLWIKKKQDYITEPIVLDRLKKIHQRKPIDTIKPSKFKMVMLGVIKALGIMLLFALPLLIHEFYAPKGYRAHSLNESGIGIIPLLFLSLGLMGLFIHPLNNKHFLVSRFARYYNHKINVNGYEVDRINKDLKILHYFAFYTVLITMPFYILAFNVKFIYNEQEMIMQRYFEFKETKIEYASNIVRIERYFGRNRFNDKVTSAHYVIYYDDTSIDILFGTDFSEVVRIHTYIKDMRPDLYTNITLESDEVAYIESKTKKNQVYLYDIFS